MPLNRTLKHHDLSLIDYYAEIKVSIKIMQCWGVWPIYKTEYSWINCLPDFPSLILDMSESQKSC